MNLIFELVIFLFFNFELSIYSNVLEKTCGYLWVKISLIILKGCDTMIFNIHESGKIAMDKMIEKSNSKDKNFK